MVWSFNSWSPKVGRPTSCFCPKTKGSSENQNFFGFHIYIYNMNFYNKSQKLLPLSLSCGNPPLLQGSQKETRYAAMASRCFGVNPPKAMLGRSWL
jgi:hypothetical protein